MSNSLPKNERPPAWAKARCVNGSYSISVVAPVGSGPTNMPTPVLILIVNRLPPVSEAYMVVVQSTGVGVDVGVFVGVTVGVFVAVGVLVGVAVAVDVGVFVGVFVVVGPAVYCTRRIELAPRAR